MRIRMVACIMLTLTAVLCGLSQARAASPAEKAKASLDNYIKAWHEPDDAKRTELLSDTWVDEGTYTDPSAHVEGRDALVKHISRFLSNPQFKGFTLVRSSDIDFHHHTFRFEWEMKDAAGNTAIAGMDYGEFNDNGAITKIVGFFGPFPELK